MKCPHSIKTRKLTQVECVEFYLVLSRSHSSGHWHNPHAEVVYHHKDVPHSVPSCHTQPLSPPPQPLACSPYLKFCHFQNVLCHITWFSFPECGRDTKTVGHARGRKGKVGGKRSPPPLSFPPSRGCRRRALRAGCRASMTLELLSLLCFG